MIGWLAAHWLLAAPALFVVVALTPVGGLLLRTRAGVAVLVTLLALAALQWYGARRFADGAASVREAANAHALAADLDALRAKQDEEATRGRYLAGVDAAYQRGLTDAKRAGDDVAAGLRSGALQLQRRWRGCEAQLAAGRLSGATPGAGGADAAADDRDGSAGRIVGAAAAVAQQVRCLQAVALIDRGQDPGDLSAGCPFPKEL